MLPETLILCNRKVVDGEPEIRDLGAVVSAATRPDARIRDIEAYPTPSEKAAALLCAVIRERPFAQRNDATAWVATRLLLMVCHGMEPGLRGARLFDLMDSIADHSVDIGIKAVADALAVRPM
jgi:hypothetical protein